MRALTTIAALLLFASASYAQKADFELSAWNDCCGTYIDITGTASRSAIKSKTIQEYPEYRVKVHGVTGTSIAEIGGGTVYKQRGPAQLVGAGMTEEFAYTCTVAIHMVGNDGCGFTVTIQLVWIGSDDKGWYLVPEGTPIFTCD